MNSWNFATCLPNYMASIPENRINNPLKPPCFTPKITFCLLETCVQLQDVPMTFLDYRVPHHHVCDYHRLRGYELYNVWDTARWVTISCSRSVTLCTASCKKKATPLCLPLLLYDICKSVNKTLPDICEIISNLLHQFLYKGYSYMFRPYGHLQGVHVTRTSYIAKTYHHAGKLYVLATFTPPGDIPATHFW